MKSIVLVLACVALASAFETSFTDHFDATFNDDLQIDAGYQFPDKGEIRLGACNRAGENHVTISVDAELDTPPLRTLVVFDEDTENEEIALGQLTDAGSISYHHTVQIPHKVLSVDADPTILYATEGSRVQRLGKCSQMTQETIYGGAEDAGNGNMTRAQGPGNSNKPGWWWKWHHGNKNFYRGGWYCNCHDNSGKHLIKCNPNGKIVGQQHGFIWKTTGNGNARGPEVEIDREIMALHGQRDARKGDMEVEISSVDRDFGIYVGFLAEDVGVSAEEMERTMMAERNPNWGPNHKWKWKGHWWGGGKWNCKAKFESDPVHVSG